MLQDARDYQILFLSLFLGLGIFTRDWTLQPLIIGVAIATSLTVQLLASLYIHRRIKPAASFDPALRSALITALGLSLLLRTGHWTTMALAATLAILSKFILRVNHKHFFNPANFGIIAVLLFTQDAWVSPGQWGEVGWYGLLFVGAGGIVLKRVGRWDTTAVFLSTYTLLGAIRNLWLGWSWDVLTHQLMSGSLLLFALFMLTDPRSIPDARSGRVVWGVAISLLTFVLQSYFSVTTAIFWALFALAPLTILLDGQWLAPRFCWEGKIEHHY
ncbi:Electron transport complex subunit RsxD [Acaryochloris thomasi RCC1774]|uniref:Electron transport complex subunit RsxD n=1 Tax=Acaryochloris thomasi RCC1774 TaxID=1764569 RepID=A0A2W1JUR4_9CYAN|nr:RnfABCDGE type electron transport complex subunit D [Acaryochloris thomasi]PZD74695.1 Electron transport complex subunit RsxD [Acaryochloris thomasi RCC1774]